VTPLHTPRRCPAPSLSSSCDNAIAALHHCGYSVTPVNLSGSSLSDDLLPELTDNYPACYTEEQDKPCKNTPADTDWPSNVVWQVSTLIKKISLSSTYYTGEVTYNEAITSMPPQGMTCLLQDQYLTVWASSVYLSYVVNASTLKQI